MPRTEKHVIKSRRKLALSILIITLTIALVLKFSPLTIQEKHEAVSCTIVVTLDYGKEVILERRILVEEGTSVMQALKLVADVETAYGGGFVSAINGIHSGYMVDKENKTDWFFYVNGFLSNKGALDYKIVNGDLIQWDFHYWGFRPFRTAIVGAFPAYFTNGYEGKLRPTVLVYEELFEGSASRIKRELQERGLTVELIPFSSLSAEIKANSNIILVASSNNSLVVELNRLHEKLGFSAYFEGGKLVSLNCRGETEKIYEGDVGVVQATQNVWNPKGNWACENVILLITGLSEKGVESAVDALIDEDYKYSFAFIVFNGSLVRIPA